MTPDRTTPGAGRLAFRDRIAYGAIAMVFGVLLGSVAAIFLVFEFDTAFLWQVVVFSALFFFAVGFVRGADAGSFAGQSLGAAVAVAADDGTE